jgi:hypothetical protein
MLGSITAIAFFAAMATVVTGSGWVAYRSYSNSVIENLIGDRQLANLLRKGGLLDEFARGRMHCAICGDVLRRTNLRLVVLDKAGNRFTCGKLRCTSEIIARQAQLIAG